MCSYDYKHQKAREVIRKHGPLGVVFLIMAALLFVSFFAFLFGGIVKVLWNYTIADIFNVSKLTYLQAVALIVLARLLFGGFGHKNHASSNMHHKIKRKFCKDYDEYWKKDGKEAIDNFVEKSLDDKKPS